MNKRKNSGPLFFKPERTGTKKTPRADVVVFIDRLSGEGRGMAFHQGKPLFIANTLPGETVRASIALDKREYAEAQLREVIAASPQRIAPRCEIFGRCGGCALQMLDNDAQRRHKSEMLLRLLQTHIAQLSEPIVAAPWHYRHRARLAVGEENGKPVIGFKGANSHRVISVSTCVILDEHLQTLLMKLPQWLAQLSQWRRIEEIRIAIDSAATIALTWNAKRALPAADIDTLMALCEAENIACSAEATLVYRVPSQNTAFDFSLTDFTQVNPVVNDQLVVRALTWLAPEKSEIVADFFCGLGNFSLPLAQYAAHVTGYEVDAAMVARAAANAAAVIDNNVSVNNEALVNIEFRAVDLYAADAIIADAYDAALLDPPRAGAKALCEQLAKTKKLQRIVYVSCNPHTLIRDIDILCRGGFSVERAALVDMFPQTGHTEAIVKLHRTIIY